MATAPAPCACAAATWATRPRWRTCWKNCVLKVPTPKAYGIGQARYDEAVPIMAERALVNGSPDNNPRIPSADEIVSIYREIYA
jgi:hypothetical protein